MLTGAESLLWLTSLSPTGHLLSWVEASFPLSLAKRGCTLSG